jgi:hypothetical protein
MCYSCSIHNIINSLGKRIKNPEMKYSLSYVNKVCEYDRFFACRDPVVEKKVDDLVKIHGFRYKEESGNLRLLREIVDDDDTSYPIISINPEWFTRMYGIRIEGRPYQDHVIVIMGINHEYIYFFDPFENYIPKSFLKKNSIPRTIGISAMEDLWSKTEHPFWIGWIYRSKGTPLQQDRLSTYLK